jgi:hypothetical protein
MADAGPFDGREGVATRIMAWGEGRGKSFAGVCLAAAVVLFVLAFWPTVSDLDRVRRWIATGLFPLALLAAALLNGRRAFRASRRLTRATGLTPDRVYWIGLAALLAAGLICRVAWTRAVCLPVIQPDSVSYWEPALRNPIFPLDEIRAVAVPYLVAASLAAFHHPIGILIAQNVLALGSALLLGLALGRRSGMRAAGLLLIAYILFCEKNAGFEYYLMSEHLARCLYVIFVAGCIGFRNPASPKAAACLALVAIANILTKPSAVILVPVFLAWLAISAATSGAGSKKALLRAAAVYVCMIAAALGIYATMSLRTFGSFEVTSMGGISLYWHVHPLTNLDGPAFPEIKTELKRFFPLYLSKYAEKGKASGDWAVFGSTNRGLRADFGDESPGKVVSAYALWHGSGSLIHRQNEIFRRLSIEGIRAHPLAYVLLSLRGVYRLVADGLTFSYWPRLPFADVSGARAASQQWFDRYIPGPPGSLLRTTACRAGAPSRAETALLRVPELAARVAARGFPLLLGSTLAAAGALIFLLPSGLPTRRAYGQLALFLLVPSTYILFCGFLIPAEPPRLLTNVQDMLVAAPLLLLSAAAASLLAAAERGEDRSAS